MKTNPIKPIPEDPAERRAGISQEDYLSLFLIERDYGGKLKMVQDSRLQGPDPKEVAFPRYQGIMSGFAVWMGEMDEPIFRSVDIRFVFPTAWQASAFHAAQLDLNSEGNPPLPDAPPVGQECRVFYGVMVAPQFKIRHFFYIFRIHRVVVKLYAAQGPVAAGNALNVSQVAGIARLIEGRIKATLD